VASCDLAVASENSSFATPGIKVGLFCTTPGVALVRQLNSEKKALEMLLTGDFISAKEALHYGLVNKVVPLEQLDNATMELVEKIISYPPNVISLGKRAFYEQLEKSVDSAYNIAETEMVENLNLPETKEGISSFLQKRKPNW
jgi:enoyl-CoA hydratase/carnithine racemase